MFFVARMGMTATSALLVFAPFPAHSAAAPADFHRYVALGDSYAAVGTLTTLGGDPSGCARAADNYPSKLAQRLGVSNFVDVSCFAATTVHMTSPQQTLTGINPAQFDTLTEDTDLVTITVGGNDSIGGPIVGTCGPLGLMNRNGAPCRDHFQSDGHDELTEAIAATAPKLAAVLAGITARAPRATVVVVGTLRQLPATEGCWPSLPIATGDIEYVNELLQQLNSVRSEQAAAAGALYIDPSQVTGHDMCQAPNERWVELPIPATASVPAHPNVAGQEYVAQLVATSLANPNSLTKAGAAH